MEQSERTRSLLRIATALLVAAATLFILGLLSRTAPVPVTQQRQERAVRDLVDRMESLERSEEEIRRAVQRLLERYPERKQQ